MGSVGVVLMHREVSRALDNAGVKVNIITAGHYKAAGNMAEPLSGEMRAYIQSNIDSVYELFLQAVEQGRQTKKPWPWLTAKYFWQGMPKTWASSTGCVAGQNLSTKLRRIAQ